MDADKLEAIIASAVTQYADATPADRPAIAEAAAGCHLRPGRSMSKTGMRGSGNWPSASSLSAREHRRQKGKDAPRVR
jgi:hypothetical protein